MPLRPGGRIAGGLWRLRSFRLLFVAALASAAGTWLAFVALVLDVFARTSSASWVSALMVAEFLPLVVAGLVAGPLVDRLPRKLVLVGADAVRAVVFCILPFATSALQIVALALIAGIASSLFRPALYAGLPNIVSDDDLSRANGLLQAAENVILAVGPVIGGVLVAWAGPDPAYWANAASFVVSALLILRVAAQFEQPRPGGGGQWRELLGGLSLARRPGLKAVIVVWSLVMAAAGLMSVSEVILAKDVYAAGDTGYGLMLSAMGVGLVFGGLRASEWIEHRGVRPVYTLAVISMAVGVGAAAAAPGVWVAAAALVVSGVGNGVALVGNATLVQRSVPDAERGRAFALAMSSSYTALGLGMIAAGPLTETIGAREAWGIAGGVTLAAALSAAALTRSLPWPTRRLSSRSTI